MFPIRLAICSLSLENLTLWTQCQSHHAAKLSSERVIFVLLDNTLDTMYHLHFKGPLRASCGGSFFHQADQTRWKSQNLREEPGMLGFGVCSHLCCSEMHLIWDLYVRLCCLIWEQSARFWAIFSVIMQLLRCSVWLLGCLSEHHCLYVPGIRGTVSGLFEVFMNQIRLFTFIQAIGPTSRFPVLLRRLSDVRRLPMSSSPGSACACTEYQGTRRSYGDCPSRIGVSSHTALLAVYSKVPFKVSVSSQVLTVRREHAPENVNLVWQRCKPPDI